MSKGRYFCGGSALAVTIALAIGAPAMAQDAAAAFRAADANKDGKLDATEFQTLPQSIRDKAVDANGDGFYSLAELTPAASANDATTVREIVSVGTYLKSGSEDTALNVEAQSRDDLLKTGSPGVDQLIRNLSETGLNNNGDNAGQNSTGYGVRTINLRNLGSGRTLILFDGVRLADDPQTNGGPAVTFDPNVNGGGAQNVNSIPMEILQTVEVLKDGGSAAYGAGAAGGAINFSPRRDLNGFEASVNYKYIKNTDGYYDANIQWGKRKGQDNFLFSAFFSHQSPLAAVDRSFVTRSFLFTQTNSGWGTWDYNLATFAFSNPAGSTANAQFGRSDPLLLATAGVGNAPGGAPAATATTTTGPGFTLPTQGNNANGMLRDDGCIAEGGTRNWVQTSTSNPLLANPVCGFQRYLEGNLEEATNTYRLVQDSTVNMTDNLRWHTSTLFTKSQTTVVGAQVQEANACDPWPEIAPSFTTSTSTTPSRACTAPGINSTVGGTSLTSGPTVPGYNPAVRDYLLRYYANPIGSNTNGQRVFSDATINTITGCASGSENQFNCSNLSNTGTGGVGARYNLGNGTITNGIFTPGSTSLTGNTSLAAPTIGTNSSVAAGPTLGQGYVPTSRAYTVQVNTNTGTTTTPTFTTAFLTTTGNPGQYGRVDLVGSAYGPFITMYNSAFKGGKVFFNSQNVAFSTTQDIKGDLGEHFGNALDFTAKANYARNMNRTTGAQVMADRFQRALDGFGTDLNNLGSDHLGCTVAETSGTRILQTAPGVLTAVTGVPYTVGAGGGADYNSTTPGNQAAALGFNPGASAGNGCYFFNPFDSAIKTSRLNHLSVVATNTDVGFVGATTPSAAGNAAGTSTAVGITGDYQGYAPGFGLENSPGLLKWMFQTRDVRSYSDQILLQGILNGEVSKFQLPGGSIDWVLGTQYRLVNRDAFTNDISNAAINPCPFLRRATGTYTALDNVVNATSTCSGTNGLFATTNGTSLTTGFNQGPIGGGFQDSVNHSIFLELQLPVLKNFNLHTIARYEEYKDPNAPAFKGDGIYSADAKWQAFDNLAFTANIGQTFQAPIIQQAGFTTTFVKNLSTTSAYYTNSTAADVNINNQSTIFVNTALGPEHGLDYGFGAIFQTRDRATQVRLQYYSNNVGGSPFSGVTASTIARTLTGNRIRNSTVDLTVVVDCNNPSLSPFFAQNAANGLFGGQAFVQFTDGTNIYNCGANAGGGPTITTFTVGGVDLNNNGTVNASTDASDLGLLINTPNQINAGLLVRNGIELSVNHRVRPMIYGGILTLNGDLTWNLKSKSTDVYAYGVFVAAGTDNIGTLNAGFSDNADVWRGSIGFNYSRGKSNLRMTMRWSGPIADNSGLGLAEAGVPGSLSNNINPANTATCDAAASGLGIPFLPQPHSNAQIAAAVGDILVGEQNSDFNCNLSDLRGYHVHGQVNVGATYQYQLPADTTITITVDNLLDTAPAYQRFVDSFNPFNTLSPEGRTIKVGLQKKF